MRVTDSMTSDEYYTGVKNICKEFSIEINNEYEVGFTTDDKWFSYSSIKSWLIKNRLHTYEVDQNCIDVLSLIRAGLQTKEEIYNGLITNNMQISNDTLSAYLSELLQYGFITLILRRV